MLKNIKAGESRVGLTTSYNRQVYHEADRFWSSQFPDDEYIEGPKTMVYPTFHHLTWLLAWERFIESVSSITTVKEGNSKCLSNFCNHVPNYMVSHSRQPWSEFQDYSYYYIELYCYILFTLHSYKSKLSTFLSNDSFQELLCKEGTIQHINWLYLM